MTEQQEPKQEWVAPSADEGSQDAELDGAAGGTAAAEFNQPDAVVSAYDAVFGG